jgi:large subunit ribosomal protein L17
MRHRKAKYSLNRFTSWREATIVSLTRNLFKYERIKTTQAKAKACQPLAEKIISLAKQNTLTQKRRAYKLLGEHSFVSLLFKDIAPRFGNRTSGFTRIIKLEKRRGDNANLVILELTEIKEKKKKTKVEKEVKPGVKQVQETREDEVKEKPVQEVRLKTDVKVLEKPPITKKPVRSFLGGIRRIFKRERDSL